MMVEIVFCRRSHANAMQASKRGSISSCGSSLMPFGFVVVLLNIQIIAIAPNPSCLVTSLTLQDSSSYASLTSLSVSISLWGMEFVRWLGHRYWTIIGGCWFSWKRLLVKVYSVFSMGWLFQLRGVRGSLALGL